jgi:predicted ATPase
LGRHLSNLPAELTSFVGRRQELRDVKRLLTTTRLLTLTGSGGVGKTKLALRAAADMSRAFPDGAWLVLLDSIRDPMLVAQAVLSALGVSDLSAGLSLSSLTEYLAGKRLLLVLDNCEHLLDGCAVLASTLLASCPDLHILATSRQALGVACEVRMVVPPMSLPGEEEGPANGGKVPVQRLLGCDAVWLLSERAAAVVPGFAAEPANAGDVLALCRKLDGIPLALELAAVRLGSLSLEQLNRGLESELSILGTANRGAEARQQTLEATIGWSYGLLAEAERLLWARLSVFSGGFEEDAATEVCADTRIPAGMIPGLAPEDSVPRARLLWVAAVMASSQNDHDDCAALSAESLRIATEARDVEAAGWARAMSAIPRLRAADLAGAKERIESALALARLMHLGQVELTADNVLSAVLIAAGDIDRVIEIRERDVALSEERGESWARGYQLTYLAQAYWLRGDRGKAEALAREAAVRKLAVDDLNGLTMVLETLASMAADQRRHERAAIFLGAAQRVRDESSLTLIELFREQHQRSVSLIIRGIGQKRFDAAFGRGRAMTIDEGVAFATEREQPGRPPAKAGPDTDLTPR